MDPTSLLFCAHVQNTESNPLCYNRIDISKIKNVPHSEEKFKKLIQTTFSKFKTCKEGKSVGSVHYNPEYWTFIFLSVYDQTKNTEFIDIPNGCCTSKSCPIKKYYELLGEILSM